MLWPTPDGAFPWTTFTVNVVGCAVIGAFTVLITDVRAVHRLARPFFGTGVLGGFTTFSTYAVDIRRLVGTGHPGTGLGYLAATL
ncbi:fluoride efflux transporter FluC, partial [Streptomyces sp. NPDC058398]|uniref:fluoride efflux transporter FluC n=1 Tax=Streptomyces sp. NPDC058398 TaxID=3346479 RepID=UPI00364F73D5